MKIAKHFAVVSAAVLLVTAGMVPPAYAGELTVGDFFVSVAEVKKLNATNGRVAERSLRAAGYDLPKIDLDTILTEGVVAAISNSVGIRVTTSTPDAKFDEGRVNSYMAAFGGDLIKKPGDPTDPKPKPAFHKNDPSGKGKGKKKKKSHKPNTASRGNGQAHTASTNESDDEHQHRIALSQACFLLGQGVRPCVLLLT